MASFETITRVLALAAAAYPSFDLQPETVKVYLKLLADLPDGLLEAAALDHIASSAFFPTVAELRRCAAARSAQASPPPVPIEAWAEVEEQVERAGYTGQPVFTHPLTARVVRALGWQNLCRSDNPVADRARFLAAYADLRESEPPAPRALPDGPSRGEALGPG